MCLSREIKQFMITVKLNLFHSNKITSFLIGNNALKYYYCINALSLFIAPLRMSARLIVSYEGHG